MSAGMNRAILYGRVSHASGDQDPESQLILLRAFAAARGWDVIAERVDRASAVNLRRRTAWQQVMHEAQSGDVVAVFRLDRAFRSTLQAAQDIEYLKQRGVHFVSTQEGFDLTTSGGQFMFDVLVAFAALERRSIGERIRAGKERARRQGLPTGGFPRGMKRQGIRGPAVVAA